MRVAIYTLGCKVNQYETQAMEQELQRRGHTLVDFESRGGRLHHQHLLRHRRQR